MPSVLCLLNHDLTKRQSEELVEKYSAFQIMYPPDALKKTWASIPTNNEISGSELAEFTDWIIVNSKPGDYLVVQGEFGSTFYLVEFAFAHHLIPLHSVTKRIAREMRINEVVRRTYIFEHIRFRRYAVYEEGINGNSIFGF